MVCWGLPPVVIVGRGGVVVRELSVMEMSPDKYDEMAKTLIDTWQNSWEPKVSRDCIWDLKFRVAAQMRADGERIARLTELTARAPVALEQK